MKNSLGNLINQRISFKDGHITVEQKQGPKVLPGSDLLNKVRNAENNKDIQALSHLFGEARQQNLNTVARLACEAMDRVRRGVSVTHTLEVKPSPARHEQNLEHKMQLQASQKQALIREYCRLTKITDYPAGNSLSLDVLRQKIRDARRTSHTPPPAKKDGKKTKDGKGKTKKQ